MKPAVLSVIMPNHNHAHFLGISLPAILTQSRRPDEVIIVDDASTDDSVAVIERIMAKDPVVRLVRNPKNLGPGRALSIGLAASRGAYLCFPGADDVLLPGFFEKSLALLDQHPEAGHCSTLTRAINPAGEDEGLLRPSFVSSTPCFIPPAAALDLLSRHGNWFMGNTAVFRRSHFNDCGGFDPDLRSFADDFLSQVLACRFGACFIPEALAAWRRAPDTYSHKMANDYEISLAIIARSMELMRTTYRGIFPEGYIRRLERRLRYHNLSGYWETRLHQSLGDSSLAGSAGSFHRRALRPLLGLARTLCHAAIQSYLFIRFRRQDVGSIISRRLGGETR